jgi:hypothetical protein
MTTIDDLQKAVNELRGANPKRPLSGVVVTDYVAAGHMLHITSRKDGRMYLLMSKADMDKLEDLLPTNAASSTARKLTDVPVIYSNDFAQELINQYSTDM